MTQSLAVHVDFVNRYGRLDPARREAVGVALERGLTTDPVPGARDERLRTATLTDRLSAVVVAADPPLLLGLHPTDEATAVAERSAVTVNGASGVLEITDLDELERLLPEYRKEAEKASARLFDRLTDDRLRALGISPPVLDIARTIRDLDQLRTLENVLPEAQYTTLHLLGDGLTPDPPERPESGDLAAAIRRSQGRIALVDGPAELLALLAVPPSRQRIFLTPAQEAVAYRHSFPGPATVFGGPGTGKSVVALHRVKHLLARSAGPVLLTSFSDELTDALDRDLSQLVDATQRAAVRVLSLGRFADETVSAEQGPIRYVTDAEHERLWADAARRTGGRFGPHFLRREWEDVVFAQRVADLDGYLAAGRRGRGLRLSTAQKQQLWPGLAEASRVLLATGVRTPLTVADQAAQLLASRPDKPFAHVVVDEVQDLHPAQWRLLRAAVAAGPDDLFLIGDPHQRIHGHRVHLAGMGVDVGDRTVRLTANHRTTAEVLDWAVRVLEETDSDDLNGGVDSMRGYRAARHGPAPEVVGYLTAAEEFAGLAEAVAGWRAEGVPADEIGVAARTPAVADRARSMLDGVFVGTMHALKGLEFRRVALIGVNAGAVPDSAALTPEDDDPLGYAMDVQQERSLLFVAATRTRESLRVSWWGTPSPLLPR
ncbi:UvrD-helicase domain-containing protein [Cryptosporangium phraense]|uniref:DNA 3'-5' helicase n=1 Tax=Cryptosporangium phraense TaxID=2593070 RepID=A0A545APN8_9ACTN|nr:UvrD-helicase domain-containing protein [Cryptosporangium phraense]TQS43284.1 AAA family ATPase [Cryptosporangium phraense]